MKSLKLRQAVPLPCATLPGRGGTGEHLLCLDLRARFAHDVATVSEGLAKPRILVVDDDELVRFVVRTVLDSAEVEIVEAQNGAEAVEKFFGPEGPFSLVLMDMFMPGMNGPEALQIIRAKAPEARLVLLSGSPEHPPNSGNLPGVSFFPKPFVNEELVSLVRKELGLGPPAEHGPRS